MAELLAEFLGRFLLAFGDLSAIDHNVVLVGAAVDLDGTESEVVETHTRTPWTLASGALVRRDSGEGGPALLNVLAAAVRTQDFALFVVASERNLVEEFLAIVAQEFVVRHRDLARSG